MGSRTRKGRVGCGKLLVAKVSAHTKGTLPAGMPFAQFKISQLVTDEDHHGPPALFSAKSASASVHTQKFIAFAEEMVGKRFREHKKAMKSVCARCAMNFKCANAAEQHRAGRNRHFWAISSDFGASGRAPASCVGN